MTGNRSRGQSDVIGRMCLTWLYIDGIPVCYQVLIPRKGWRVTEAGSFCVQIREMKPKSDIKVLKRESMPFFENIPKDGGRKEE